MAGKIKIIDRKCFCCQNSIEVEHTTLADPTTIGFVYDGLIFRATGNYGSAVFDPCPDNGYIEIFICDKCVLKNLSEVTRVKNIKRSCTADVSVFDPSREF